MEDREKDTFLQTMTSVRIYFLVFIVMHYVKVSSAMKLHSIITQDQKEVVLSKTKVLF